MKPNKKKPIHKPNKSRKTKPILPQEEISVPTLVMAADSLGVLLCQPHKYYKVKGIKKILYAGADYMIDGVENPQRTDPSTCIIEVSSNEENTNIKLMKYIQNLGFGGDAIEQMLPYMDRVIPILVESQMLQIQLTEHAIWPQKILETISRATKDTNKRKILVAGNKNTGKSTLCTYLQQQFVDRKRSVCLLDLDVGKGRGLPATINLYRHTGKQTSSISYWIGQYTPLNFVILYLESVIKIIDEYNSSFFDDVLIVNTMGYLTGFGELIMSELYRIIQPAQVLYMAKQQQKHSYDSFRLLLKQPSSKMRLLDREYSKFTATFQLVTNHHATTKPNINSKSKSFQDSLNLKSLEDMAIHRVPQVVFKQITLQSKDGLFIHKDFCPLYTDLQLLILCDLEGSVYKLKGLGFGFQGKVFSHAVGQVCIKSQIVQFQKQFYNLTQKQLISLEQTIQCPVDFLLPVYRGLGGMGYRNLSSKRTMRGQV